MTLYVTDLDGTLLNMDGKLKSRYAELINRLVRRGIHITYATARGYQSAKRLTKDLQLTLPVITMNGAIIANSITGEKEKINFFDKTALETVKEYFAVSGDTPLVYTLFNDSERVCYLLDKTEGIKKYLQERKDDPRLCPVKTQKELFRGDVFYICLINPISNIDKLKSVFTKEKGFGYNYEQNIYDEKEHWFEIFNYNASKGNGVNDLKKITGADKVVVFGDSFNDISMFQVADEGYSVIAGIEELKKISTKVIGSPQNGAVPVFIEKRETTVFSYEPKEESKKSDTVKFKNALSSLSYDINSGIGTLNEKAIHRTLKYYFSNEIDHEAKIGGYYADIVGENGIIEIQTGNFGKLNSKLECFLNLCHVTVVYPFEKRVNLSAIDKKTGEVRNRTTNHKDLTKFFLELYRIRSFLTSPNLTICLVELEIDKIVIKDKGKKISAEKKPLNILSEIYFEKEGDYSIFIPKDLPDVFTKAEFNKKSDINKNGLLLEILEYAGLVRRISKKGAAFLYECSRDREML